MAVVISLANQKGGVAKTTTCLNLGAGLASHGIKTLLIDSDPQGSLTRYLGYNGEQSEFSPLGDWLLGRKEFSQVETITPYSNLSFIPANEDLISAEAAITKDTFKALHYLRLKINEIRAQFDVILVDTMPSFSPLFANALVASDQVIIPVKLEWLSVQGLAPLLGKVREVQQIGKGIEILGIVGTFHRKGVNEVAKCLKEIRDILPGRVFETTIHLNSRLAEAAGEGLPIQVFDRNSQGAYDYEALTEEVITRCQLKPVAAVQ